MKTPKINGVVKEFELVATCVGVLLSGWQDELETQIKNALTTHEREVGRKALSKGYLLAINHVRERLEYNQPIDQALIDMETKVAPNHLLEDKQ